MTDITELTERLHLERDALTIGDADAGLRNVRRIVRRRRRQHSLVGAAAVGGLLAAGVGVASLIGSDTKQVIVTDTAPAVTTGAEAASTPATSAPPATIATPGTTEPSSTATSTPEPTPAVPSVGAAVVGRSVDADLVDVTAELRASAGDFFLNWQVPWNDGFLIGGQISGTDAWASFFSPDGRTWEPVELEPGFDGVAQDGVTVAEGRLVMLSARPEGESWTPVVASTTDLSNWTVEDIPIETPWADLPTTVEAFTWPQTIAANADGWIAVIENSMMLDSRELVQQRTGRTATSLSEARSEPALGSVSANAEIAPLANIGRYF